MSKLTRCRILLYTPPPDNAVNRESHTINGVSAIQAVEALGHNMMIDRKTLEQVRDLGNAAPKGIKVRFTHPQPCGEASLGKFLGRGKDFFISEDGSKTKFNIHLSRAAAKSPKGDLRDYVETLAEDEPDMFGMSIVFSGQKVWIRENGEEVSARKMGRPADATTKKPVARVEKLHAVDVVDEPAANRDGMFGANPSQFSMVGSEIFATIDTKLNELSIEPNQLPALTETYFDDPDSLSEERPLLFDFAESLTSAFPTNREDAVSLAWRYVLAREVRPTQFNQGQESPTTLKEAHMPNEMKGEDKPDVAISEEQVQAALDKAISANPFVQLAQEQSIKQVIDAQTDLLQSQRDVLHSQTFTDVDELNKAIAMQKAVLAEASAGSSIDIGNKAPRQPNITVGLTSLDQFKAAFTAMIQGVRPSQDVRPLSGIREAYMLATGDWELHGLFRDERVSLAAVTTTTFAELVAEHINKVVVSNMQMFDKWWERGVTQRNFTSLKDIHWVKVSGIGELPTVTEGANYTELKWDSQEETAAFVKKGGYLGLTLEAIDADDTGWLQNAAPALARAAHITLGKKIASIFTDNAAVSNGNNLFSAGNSNTDTLTLNDANYRTVKIAMQKQTDHQPTGGQTQERLGGLLSPELLWVPIDLEDTAVQVLSSVPVRGTTNTGDENPDARGNDRETRLANARSKVIKVPFWTSTTGWYAQANKMLWPSVGLGFRFGETPELFSVQDPRAGLIFSNDVFPVKVRYFFAAGAIDHKGLYRGNA